MTVGDATEDLALQPVTLPRDPRHLRQRLLGELRRAAHADDAGDVLGPHSAPVLLRPADDQWLEAQPAARVQPADALGAVELVCCEAHRVEADLGDVYRELADRLRAVGVE